MKLNEIPENKLQERWSRAVERMRDGVPPVFNLDGSLNQAADLFVEYLAYRQAEHDPRAVEFLTRGRRIRVEVAHA